MTRITLALTAALASRPHSLAAPKSYEGTGADRDPTGAEGRHARGGLRGAQANCLVCHSVDYIAMQPPGKGAAFWESEVTKMVKVYHAPIDEGQAKAIAAYLTDTY